jgi:hypothetical protein
MEGKENIMRIELTEQQRQALAQAGEAPLRIVDPATNTTYYLVRAELYTRMQTLLQEDDVRLMEPLLADLAPEDWEDATSYGQSPS